MDALSLEEISRAIQARHLATPLASAIAVHPDEGADAARRRLLDRQFDSAPVLENGAPVGILHSTSNERGLVRDCMDPVGPRDMVSADTAMADVVRHLCDQPFLLVLQGRTVTGFVTPADLGSAAGRTHYYLLLAALEIALARLARATHPTQADAVRLLSPGRQAKHAELVADLRATDDFIDEIAALSLVDLLAVGRVDEALVAAATRGGRSWRWLTRGLVAFRNDVMHPARDFTPAAGSAIKTLAAFDERLATLIAAAEETLTERPFAVGAA